MDAAALFTQHAVALERLAARIVGDREEARDVVGDAFTALLANGPSDPHHAIPWLYVTVRHRAYNRVRRQKMVKRRLPALLADTDPAPDPESTVRHDPLVGALVATATANLNERDRIAISMRHVEQASYDEIAAALGTTVMQARVVVHRANGKLRHHVLTLLSRRCNATRRGSVADGANVSDDLSALLHVPVVLHRPSRVADTIRGWWHRVRATSGEVVFHVGHVLTPAVAAVAVTTASAVSVPLAPPRPSELVAAPLRASVPHHHAESALSVGPTTTTPILSQANTLSTIAETIGLPFRIDDPSGPIRPSRPVEDHPLSLLGILGLPLDVLDPLELPSFPEIDIRAFELATMAGPDGRPSALRWRIELAAPLQLSSSRVWAHWHYEHDGNSSCYMTFNWPPIGDGPSATYCPVDVTVDDISVEYQGVPTYPPTEVVMNGSVIEGKLPFASLDESTRKLLYPGARLIEVSAGSACPDPNMYECQAYDIVPDDKRGFTYRVEQ